MWPLVNDVHMGRIESDIIIGNHSAPPTQVRFIKDSDLKGLRTDLPKTRFTSPQSADATHHFSVRAILLDFPEDRFYKIIVRDHRLSLRIAHTEIVGSNRLESNNQIRPRTRDSGEREEHNNQKTKKEGECFT